MTRTRRIVIVLVVVLVVLIGLFVVVKNGNKERAAPSTVGTGNRVNPTYFAVNLTNARSYKNDIPSISDYELWNALWKKTNQNIEQRQDYYFGNVRDGSLQKTTSTDGVPIISFIVDMPEQKRSLKVTLDGSEESGYFSTYISCPSDTELVYEKVPCAEDNE